MRSRCALPPPERQQLVAQLFASGQSRTSIARRLQIDYGTVTRDLRAIGAALPPRRRPLAERLWEKIARGAPEECWPWKGSRDPNGYGQINAGGKYGRRLRAHRVAYELVVGKIPDGHDIDHLCENKACCNPAHLEPVTRQDNMLRFHGKRTHCKRGHPLDGLHRGRLKDGTPAIWRTCITCRRDGQSRRR